MGATRVSPGSTDDAGRRAAALNLIRAEYLEVPGLSLSVPQAGRMWGLDERASAALLGALVEAGFLRRTPAGLYVRSTSH